MIDKERSYTHSRQYLRNVMNVLLLRRAAGHILTVFPDDTFLVSYPGSASTWTRWLIANLLPVESPIAFETIDQLVPDIYSVTDRALRRLGKPRFLNSHEPFDPRYPRVIYLVRDPRDVVVSRYYSAARYGAIPGNYDMDDFVARFVTGDVDLERRTGPWGDHVLSWLAMRSGQPSFLLLRYEDLTGDALNQLARLASFLNLKVDEGRLTRAAEPSSRERICGLDRNPPRRWMGDAHRDAPSVSEVMDGGWRLQLSQSSVAAIESAWWPLMNLLGYEVLSSLAGAQSRPLVNQSLCEGLANRVLTHTLVRHSAATPIGGAEGSAQLEGKGRGAKR